MKIHSDGSVRLVGPLSRNDRLMQLKPGDQIDVKILERTGKDSAVIDLLGNKVHAHFSSSVPHGDRLTLMLSEIKNEILYFSLRAGADTSRETNFLAHTIIREKDISFEKIRTFLLALRAQVPGAFQLSVLLAHGDGMSKSGIIRRLLDEMSKSGYSRDRITITSALLSGLSDDETARMLEILSGSGMMNQDADISNADRMTAFAQLISCGEKCPDFLIRYNDGDADREIEWMRDAGGYAGRIETPHLGVVEFVVRKEDSLSVSIVCDEGVRDSLVSHVDELHSALTAYYPRVSVTCMTRIEWSEKVLAFADKIGNRSFDVIA
ncbi:MAG TPA: hypothetical protein VF857_03090 [Spirochaetota bacterium]